MKSMIGLSLSITLFVFLSVGFVAAATPVRTASAPRYPKIEIYTAPWCKSCSEASAYLTKNNIPFLKKDVFANEAYMDEMTSRYRSSAVPVIVIGNDEKVLKGFVVEAFQMAVRDVIAKRR
jgi:glutaredoxin 3